MKLYVAVLTGLLALVLYLSVIVTLPARPACVVCPSTGNTAVAVTPAGTLVVSTPPPTVGP